MSMRTGIRMLVGLSLISAIGCNPKPIVNKREPPSPPPAVEPADPGVSVDVSVGGGQGVDVQVGTQATDSDSEAK